MPATIVSVFFRKTPLVLKYAVLLSVFPGCFLIVILHMFLPHQTLYSEKAKLSYIYCLVGLAQCLTNSPSGNVCWMMTKITSKSMNIKLFPSIFIS